MTADPSLAPVAKDGIEPNTEETERKIRRLERRLTREREARLLSERIAEDRTRDLYRANQDLDERIGQRTAELDAALAAAKSANNAKTRFLVEMSHQAKTPLNGVLGMLELLGGELYDEQNRRWHAAATQSARRLDRLVQKLTRYTDLENVDLRASAPSRPLDDLLVSVEDRWTARCLRAGQLLAIERPIGVDLAILAPPELDLLIDELMGNVVEHTDRGAVTVRLGASPTDETVRLETVRLEIVDPGEGLDPSDLARAHELGAIEDQTERADRPIGLGLALVDRIVCNLGGSWGVLAKPEAGVYINLPLAVDSSDTPRPGWS